MRWPWDETLGRLLPGAWDAVFFLGRFMITAVATAVLVAPCATFRARREARVASGFAAVLVIAWALEPVTRLAEGVRFGRRWTSIVTLPIYVCASLVAARAFTRTYARTSAVAPDQ